MRFGVANVNIRLEFKADFVRIFEWNRQKTHTQLQLFNEAECMIKGKIQSTGTVIEVQVHEVRATLLAV